MAAIKEVLQTEGQDILVFLPGRKEISNLVSQLQAQPSLVVAKLHASVSDEEKRIALTEQAQRKVVLATNVAETSLTIPNITTVIDSGLERRTIQRNGRTTLILSHISKASAAQRAGRAGRVMAGNVCVCTVNTRHLNLPRPPNCSEKNSASRCWQRHVVAIAWPSLSFWMVYQRNPLCRHTRSSMACKPSQLKAK